MFASGLIFSPFVLFSASLYVLAWWKSKVKIHFFGMDCTDECNGPANLLQIKILSMKHRCAEKKWRICCYARGGRFSIFQPNPTQPPVHKSSNRTTENTNEYRWKLIKYHNNSSNNNHKSCEIKNIKYLYETAWTAAETLILTLSLCRSSRFFSFRSVPFFHRTIELENVCKLYLLCFCWHQETPPTICHITSGRNEAFSSSKIQPLVKNLRIATTIANWAKLTTFQPNESMKARKEATEWSA